MSLEVLLRPSAARALKRLDPTIRIRILESMKELAHSPETGEQLKPSRFWKRRVGDYRIVYEIDRRSSRVVILFLGPRKNVYDEFSRLL